MVDNTQNYFIIERLDNSEESDCLKKIYDLSILDKIKENKYKKQDKIKCYKKISQSQKARIIKVVKKTILSTNFTYKWKLESFKQLLVFFHLLLFILGIASSLKGPQRASLPLFSLFFGNINTNAKIDYNVSTNFNESINNNFTNNSTMYSNYSNYNQTNINPKRNNKKLLIIASILNQLILIPIWIIFYHRYAPKFEKVDNILYKLSKYILLCESLLKGKYSYHLMEDYSILVTKKRFYNKYKKLPDEFKNKNILPLNNEKNEIIQENNIFLYCISIINDFVLEEIAIINYQQLISNEDKIDINILIKYMESSLHERIKKFAKKIIIPILFLILISIYYSQISDIYSRLYSIFIFINLLIGQYLFKKYYKAYKTNIDNFIDNFNLILIQKKRFIFRKNRLIIYFALNSNKYTKNEIINAIKKIIA